MLAHSFGAGFKRRRTMRSLVAMWVASVFALAWTGGARTSFYAKDTLCSSVFASLREVSASSLHRRHLGREFRRPQAFFRSPPPPPPPSLWLQPAAWAAVGVVLSALTILRYLIRRNQGLLKGRVSSACFRRSNFEQSAHGHVVLVDCPELVLNCGSVPKAHHAAKDGVGRHVLPT